MTAARLAVAALVLFGLAVAGASPAAPAAAGTALKTATIGGARVLTNGRGYTLYSFAPTPRPHPSATGAARRTGPR